MSMVYIMTINELSGKTELSTNSINFFEYKGFISPNRSENGHKEYTNHHLQTLLRIKLLQTLAISMEDIEEIINESKTMGEILSRHAEGLKDELPHIYDICCSILSSNVPFSELNAQKFLNRIAKIKGETGCSFGSSGGCLPYAPHPYRRYFARMLDIEIINTLFTSFLITNYHINYFTINRFFNISITLLSIITILFLEPLWLCLFGTTPGKAILGLKITGIDGKRLSYRMGFKRTKNVISIGLGFCIPIYSYIRMWKSYKICSIFQVMQWDENVAYTIKDKKAYRIFLLIAVHLIIAIVLLIVISAQQLAPNRGDLTLEQYAENHNYYCDYYDYDFGYDYLDSQGQWVENKSDQSVGIMPKPKYSYTIANGYVTGVSFSVNFNSNEDYVYSYYSYMQLMALAMAGAQREMGIITIKPIQIKQKIEKNQFQNIQFSELGLTFTCDVEYSGYEDYLSYIMLLQDETENACFRLSFAVTKQ